jgi:hypothetical protein
MSRDNYCFICGHYLADAYSLNEKNKKIYIGDHVSGNKYSKPSVENDNKAVEYEYNKNEEVLFHGECYDILSKKCKYKLKWKDIVENIEEPNAHTLVPYNDIERPPDVNKIKKEKKWSEEQIIEEWEPVIDEIKTKNVEEKKEKKEKLQLKRELRREQLRKQRDKKMEKIESMKTKIVKIKGMLTKEKEQLENKQTVRETTTSASRISKMDKAIEKLELKIEKREKNIEEEEEKCKELENEYDLFLKAWF